MGIQSKRPIEVVFGSLRANVYGAKQGIEQEMEKAANEIAKVASSYAPRDTGALENSIEAVKERQGDQLRFRIRVNPEAKRIPRGSGGRFKKGRRDLVSRYAGFMEKGFYRLGRKSQDKNAVVSATGGYVGRDFFRRAKALVWPKHRRSIGALLARRKYKYRWRFDR